MCLHKDWVQGSTDVCLHRAVLTQGLAVHEAWGCVGRALCWHEGWLCREVGLHESWAHLLWECPWIGLRVLTQGPSCVCPGHTWDRLPGTCVGAAVLMGGSPLPWDVCGGGGQCWLSAQAGAHVLMGCVGSRGCTPAQRAVGALGMSVQSHKGVCMCVHTCV